MPRKTRVRFSSTNKLCVIVSKGFTRFGSDVDRQRGSKRRKRVPVEEKNFSKNVLFSCGRGFNRTEADDHIHVRRTARVRRVRRRGQRLPSYRATPLLWWRSSFFLFLIWPRRKYVGIAGSWRPTTGAVRVRPARFLARCSPASDDNYTA